jgi:hypothetical protein
VPSDMRLDVWACGERTKYPTGRELLEDIQPA